MASIAVGTLAASFLVAAPPAAASVSFSSSSSLRMASSVSAAAPLRVKSCARPVVVMALPEKTTEIQDISEKIEKAVHEAEDACKTDDTVECVAKWEEVEELSAARAHKKVQIEMDKDPLDKFCNSFPEADECRTYED